MSIDFCHLVVQKCNVFPMQLLLECTIYNNLYVHPPVFKNNSTVLEDTPLKLGCYILLNRAHIFIYIMGVGQGYVHHEAPLIIIILNVVLLPFDNDILYMDDFTRSFYSHFHHQ